MLKNFLIAQESPDEKRPGNDESFLQVKDDILKAQR